MRVLLVFLIFEVGLVDLLVAQAPMASFTIPSTICLNENLSISNNSSNATGYVWDFCHEDLKSQPNSAFVTTLPTNGSYYYSSLRAVYDNGEWFAFCTDISGHKLYRLSFGSSVLGTPSIANLGNFGLLNSPTALGLTNENGTWYLFVVNVANTLVRLTFGNGLQNVPTQALSIPTSSSLNTPVGMKIIASGSKNYIVISNAGNGTISIFDFSSSFNSPPANVVVVGASNGWSTPWGIDIIQSGNEWYGLLACLGNSSVYKLSFGTDLLSEPSVSLVTSIPTGMDIKLLQEGDNYTSLVRSSNGLFRISFGNSMTTSNPTIENLNYLGLSSDSRNLDVVRSTPNWFGFSLEASTGKLFRVDFIGDCRTVMSTNFSNEINPTNHSYRLSSDYKIELTAFKNGATSILQKTITVQNLSATGVSITSNNNSCITGTSIFQASTSASLVDYSWDFGDGSSIDNTFNPQHQYSSTGSYHVKLIATEANGCTNRAVKQVPIYSAPQPDFDLPLIPDNPCTLQNYEFANQSSYDPPSNPTWSWSVNGTERSISENLNYTFAQIGTYQVSLKSEIPGCTNTISRDFFVEAEGVLVDFNATNKCELFQTTFTNNSIGTGDDYFWDFGDTKVSNIENPSHLFPSIGTYQITLEVSNSSGCVNSKSQNITITSTPQPTFFTDLPPFSCAGTPTQLHDATPGLTDSNVVSWNWTFPDGTSSNQKDPLHTFSQPGTYNVGLEATTNFGCSASVQLPVGIAASPSANFNVGAACLAKPTQFTNTSSSNLKSMLWTIGNNSYSVSNPVHTFNSAASYPVILTVKGANDCEASIVKNVIVRPIPILDFSTSLACSNQETIFTDQTTGSDFPASWLWNFGNSQTRTGSPANFVFDASGLFPVNLSVVTQAGCSYSTSKNILVSTSPKASFIESTSFGPPPLLVQFTNTSVNGSTAFWEFNDPQQNTSTVQNPLFTFSELGDYLVQLTACNVAGCEDTFSKVIKVLIPVVDISLEGLEVQANSTTQTYTPIIIVKNNSNIFLGDVTVLVNGISGTRLRTIVSLNIAPGNTAEVVVPLELFSRENYLCVELEVPGDIDLSNNSACKNLRGQPILVKPYPNPSSGTISFEAILEVSGSGKLRIIDAMGHMIFNQTYPEMAIGMNRVELDFSGKNPGLYLAIWELNGHKTEFRFIIN